MRVSVAYVTRIIHEELLQQICDIVYILESHQRVRNVKTRDAPKLFANRKPKPIALAPQRTTRRAPLAHSDPRNTSPHI